MRHGQAAAAREKIAASQSPRSQKRTKMIHEALDKLIKDEDLSRAEAQGAMEQILSGHASTEQIAALLVALRIKGETVDEVVGFALAMRCHATPIFPHGREHPDEVIVDTSSGCLDRKSTRLNSSH